MTKKKKGKNKTKSVVKKEYSEEEKVRVAKYKKKASREPVKFKAVKSKSYNPTIALQKSDDPLRAVKMSEAMGTADSDVQSYLLDQAIQTFKGAVSQDDYDIDKVVAASNSVMALLNGIQPRDEIEGMLAIQMVGVHNMAMDMMSRVMLGGQTFGGKQANVNQATKMLRTFIAQMDALKRYRTGGQQKMIIEHVHVNEGGQAIVGTVNQGGGKNNKCE